MRLRVKLILVYGLVVLIGSAIALIVLEASAQRELRLNAEQRLSDIARLLVDQAGMHINEELRDLVTWADMPLVVQTALDENNPELVDAFADFFSGIVSRENHDSFYMLNLEGWCIAADDRRYIHSPYSKNVASKRPGVLAAYAGKSGVGQSIFSVSTARPAVMLHAPVRHEGQVVAVLSTKVDMGTLNKHLIDSLRLNGMGDSVYVDCPGMDKTIPEGITPLHSDRYPPIEPPPEAVRLAMQSAPEGICYHRNGAEDAFMLASARMTSPPWTVTVTEPMKEVVAPAARLRHVMAVILSVLALFLLATLAVFVAPAVHGIERCRRLADKLREGQLDERLEMNGGDEVAVLARTLNSMAASLDQSRKNLIKAKEKYRNIFESAVEGIFQTTASGIVVAANSALVRINGFESAEDCIGTSAIDRYANPLDRSRMLVQLKEKGRVDNFEFDLLTVKGEIRQCELSAKAEVDSNGEISVIQGIVLDVTERKQAEKAREKALETERLLAESRWDTLRHQVNPHFLFNVLNSIDALMSREPEKAREMVSRLAEFYRSILVESADGMNTIAKEIEIVEQYLWIEKMRWGDALQVGWDIDRTLDEIRIPVFALQLLVENAVKYGQFSGADPLVIKIRIAKERKNVLIEVTNTGKWFIPAEYGKSKPGIGLANLKNRFRYIYGDKAGISMREKEGFVVVRITIEDQSSEAATPP